MDHLAVLFHDYALFDVHVAEVRAALLRFLDGGMDHLAVFHDYALFDVHVAEIGAIFLFFGRRLVLVKILQVIPLLEQILQVLRLFALLGSSFHSRLFFLPPNGFLIRS